MGDTIALRNPLKDFVDRIFNLATIVTNVAKQKLIGALNGTTFTSPTYVGHGTGAGTAAATDTTLFTEVDTRVAGTATITTTTVTNDTYQVVATLTSAAGGTITNAGLFDASTSGNMYMKGDFTGQLLAAGDKIQYTMQIKQA
jgi:hypothetical protein